MVLSFRQKILVDDVQGKVAKIAIKQEEGEEGQEAFVFDHGNGVDDDQKDVSQDAQTSAEEKEDSQDRRAIEY